MTEASYKFSNLQSEMFLSSHTNNTLHTLDDPLSDYSSQRMSLGGYNAEQEEDDAVGSQPKRRSSTWGVFFNQFYFKLALAPLIFIFSRFWSSLRIILVALNHPAANSEFLAIMTSFCDPSQGFFNSLLFVWFSSVDRTNLLHAISQFVCPGCCGSSSNASSYSASSSSLQRGLLGSHREEDTSLNIDDIENFESNRISDFSF